MSKEQVAASIRQKQSSLKSQRSSSVPQLRRSQQETQEIQQFIKAVFTKENLWFIRQEDQKNIVATLQEINQLNSELNQKCRSNEIFQRQATLFMGMSERIILLCHSVHFCLEYGFYLTEPRGLRIADAIQVAWQGVQLLAQAASQQRWPLLPDDIRMSPEQQQFVQQQVQGLQPLAQQLLKASQLKDVNHRLQVQELQQVYVFFSHVQKLLTLQDQILWAFLKQPTSKEPERNLDAVYQRLEQVGRRIGQFSSQIQQAPTDQREELQQIYVDLSLKLHDLHVPLEPYRFVDQHLKQLQRRFKESPGKGNQLLQEFRQQCISDMKFIRFVSSNLNTVGQTLHQVQSILFNLSLAFGKVYDTSNPHRVSALFLAKALKAVSGLLERGDRIAQSTEKVAFQLQNNMEGRRLFHRQVEEGILSAMRQLSDARSALTSYAGKLNAAIEELDAQPDMPSLEAYQILDQAYEEREALSGASFALGNVYEFFQSFVNSLQQAGTFFPKGFGSAESDPATEVKEMQRIYAAKAATLQQHLQDSWRGGTNLVWTVDQILEVKQRQEESFVKELKEVLEPVKLRLATLSAQQSEQDAAKEKAAKPNMGEARRVASKLGQSRDGNTARFDPYEADLMKVLRDNIYQMRSRQSRLVAEALEKASFFHGYVERVGRDYDPDEPAAEAEVMNDLLNEADTLVDFLKAIAEAKVLAYGFFDENGNALQFSEERGDFMVPRETQRHLRLMEDLYVTPKEMMARFLDVILGRKHQDLLARIIPNHVVADMEGIFMLSHDEQAIIREAMPV